MSDVERPKQVPPQKEVPLSQEATIIFMNGGNMEMSDIVAEGLSLLPYAIDNAALVDPEQVLDFAIVKQPNMIFLNIKKMPEQEIHELIETIRKETRYSKLSICLITDETLPADPENPSLTVARKYDVDFTLPSHFGVTQFIESVDQVLSDSTAKKTDKHSVILLLDDEQRGSRIQAGLALYEGIETLRTLDVEEARRLFNDLPHLASNVVGILASGREAAILQQMQKDLDQHAAPLPKVITLPNGNGEENTQEENGRGAILSAEESAKIADNLRAFLPELPQIDIPASLEATESDIPIVLVIDDSDDTLRLWHMLGLMTDAQGTRLDQMVNIQFVHSGIEAIRRLLRSPRPNLVIADIMLTGSINGLDVLNAMQNGPYKHILGDVPCAVISNNSSLAADYSIPVFDKGEIKRAIAELFPTYLHVNPPGFNSAKSIVA